MDWSILAIESITFVGNKEAVVLSQPRKPPDGVMSELLVLFLVVLFYLEMIFCGICVIWKFSIFNPRNMPTFSATLMKLKNTTAIAHLWINRRSYQLQGD